MILHDFQKHMMEKRIKEHGFVTIPHDGMVVRTEGFMQSWMHPEMEICGLYLADQSAINKLAHTLFWIAARKIMAGKRYSPGELYDEFLTDFSVKFIASGPCLRMILPDKEGNLDMPLPHPFCHQYDPLPPCRCTQHDGGS